MEKTNTKTATTQGVETGGEKLNRINEERKKQNASKSGTVRSLATVVKNLKSTNLIENEEYLQLKELYTKVVKRWMDTETEI